MRDISGGSPASPIVRRARSRSRERWALGASALAWIVSAASLANAQGQPPAGAAPPAAAPAPLAAPPPAPPGAAAPPVAAPPGAAPPGYYYPPPGGYPPPPPGYAYPPGYGYPALRAPDNVPYEGGPVPAGFHVEQRPRRGLLIAGPLVLGIPWVLGLTIASDENFPNSTGWLVVPALGPWITLAARHHSTNCATSTTYSNCIDEGLDSVTRTFLVLDALAQTAGAVMLIYGIASPKKVMVRDFASSLQLLPAPIGRTGAGGLLIGEF